MNEPKFIISEKQILDAVEYVLKVNILDYRIVDILMHDVEDEIETVLHDDCEEYKTESEEKEEESKYCDRNICVSNEYNGVGCDECVVKAERSGDE